MSFEVVKPPWQTAVVCSVTPCSSACWPESPWWIISCQFIIIPVILFLPSFFLFYNSTKINHPLFAALRSLPVILHGQCWSVSSTLCLASRSCRHVWAISWERQEWTSDSLALSFFLSICLGVTQWWMSLICSSHQLLVVFGRCSCLCYFVLQCTTAGQSKQAGQKNMLHGCHCS